VEKVGFTHLLLILGLLRRHAKMAKPLFRKDPICIVGLMGGEQAYPLSRLTQKKLIKSENIVLDFVVTIGWLIQSYIMAKSNQGGWYDHARSH
jgi:hypothetical protein